MGASAFVPLRVNGYKRSSYLNLVVANGLKWAFLVWLWIEAEWIGLSLFETHQTIVWVI